MSPMVHDVVTPSLAALSDPDLPVLPELPTLPRRLAAEPAGWVSEVDVVVVGSGIAGLTAALECRGLGSVMIVTKNVVHAGSTNWAQGGIASVQGAGDTVAQHVHDTLVAGAGLCRDEAVRILVSEGPEAVAQLIARGAEFDRDAAGELALTREGGHHRHRIAHAGGDATGAEIERALISSVRADPGIEIVEHAVVLDLLPAVGSAGDSPAVAGVTLHVLGEGTRGGVGAVRARAVILASGGIGQIYAATTNPPVSTGDGVAAALRAGARLRDIEFIQFHPTVLYLGPGARGQLPLVSEAVRGEGGHLLNGQGERFMLGRHPLAELGPRDVVAKGIMQEMAREGSDHVFVDGRMLGEETWRVRFPTILENCRRVGIDPVVDLIPVAPACHYFCGGVETDVDGATSLPGLYACGEVASSGVHGANRLGSNSLLEGLVFARRIAARLVADPPPRREVASDERVPGLISETVVPQLQQSMSRHAGGLRSADGLDRCIADLSRLAEHRSAEPGVRTWEATNLVSVAAAVVASARLREESRGAHWRSDHPEQDDRWRGHLLAWIDPDGHLRQRFTRPPVAPPVAVIESVGEAEDQIRACGLDVGAVRLIVEEALDEDLGGRGVHACDGTGRRVDVTSEATIAADATCVADLVVRSPGVLAGGPVAAYVLAVVCAEAGAFSVELAAHDGGSVETGLVVATVRGNTRAVLRAERVALNLLTLMSGVATATRAWVDALATGGTRVRDSRKTTPGLRMLQKYAVRLGGGVNHRMSLADAALIKDNHVVAAGGVVAAYQAVRRQFPDVAVQVEVTSLQQAVDVVEAGATEVLLDNMSLEEMRRVVDRLGERCVFEASGGLTIGRAAAVAATGVHYVAVGALTHSAPILDIALDLRQV